MTLDSLETVNNFIDSHEICLLYFNKSNDRHESYCNQFCKLKHLENEYPEIEVGLVLDKPEIANKFNVFSNPFTIMYIESTDVFREGVFTSFEEIKCILNRFKNFKVF